MSRKPYLEQACEAVPEFKTVSEQFLRKYTLAGKSSSCIRYLGFLSNRNKRKALETIREQLQSDHIARPGLSRAEVLTLRFGERSVLQCRECGGELLLWKSYPKERAPPIQGCA